MDPNATLARIIDAAVAGNINELDDAQDALVDWLAGGGYPPKDPRREVYQDGYEAGWNAFREGRIFNNLWPPKD